MDGQTMHFQWWRITTQAAKRKKQRSPLLQQEVSPVRISKRQFEGFETLCMTKHMKDNSPKGIDEWTIPPNLTHSDLHSSTLPADT